MALLYKTLFEVKLMHEFYLTSENGDIVFTLNSQSDRINYLLQQFANDRPSINSNVEFKFPADHEKKYNSYQLKLLSTYSGFKVAIRVNQKVLADGALVYEPFTFLPDNFNIFIQLIKKTSLLENFSRSASNNPVRSTYIFSNENILGAKVFPFLTNSISPFDAGHSYVQGDLATYGINDTREYYKNDTGDQWQSIPGNAFANENDQLLVPLRFYYSFSNAVNITNATFVLKDKNGNSIKTITVIKENTFQKALLDFSDVADAILMPEFFQYPDIIFSLEVSTNNGFLASHNLIFGGALDEPESWGLVNLKSKVTNAAFNVLADDGFLIKRKVPPGIWIEAPIFEISIKSKFPFWRFINDKGKELNLAPSLTDYLFKEGKVLLSKRPRAISASYFLLQKEGSADTIYVPNPLNYDTDKDDKERLCFNIMVPESDLFPIIP